MPIKKNFSKRFSKNRSRTGKRSTRFSKSQKGGVAPSCVSGPDLSRYRSSCHTADIHNTNLQASRDLDGAFKTASGMKGGGSRHPSSCGCKSKTVNFDSYLQEVGKQLGHQSGGGVSTLVGEHVGGMPVYKGYSDCCPPSLVGNKLLFSGTPGRATCGSGLSGGGKKKSGRKSNRSGRKSNRSGRKSNRSGRKSNKKNRMTKRNKKGQKGGHYSRSKPAPFPSSFDTPKSDFGEISQKYFNQKQPFFDPKAI
jgi:hypothetical protein